MACGAINTGSQINCNALLPGGIGGDSRLVLYNYMEVSGVTESPSIPGLVTAITLTSGASGYQFQGYKVSLKPSVDVVAGASGQNLYKHRIAFVIFENSQLQKNNIQRLALGRYIAVYENNGKDANAFEIMGLGSGMELKPQKIRDLQENNSAYMLLLETPDNELETRLPQTIGTSYSAGKTVVDGSLFLPTISNVSDLAVPATGGDAETITGTNFYGSLAVASEVTSVVWVNQATLAEVNQATYTVVSNTSITLTSPVLTAGPYKIRVTTRKGSVESGQIIVAS